MGNKHTIYTHVRDLHGSEEKRGTGVRKQNKRGHWGDLRMLCSPTVIAKKIGNSVIERRKHQQV